MDFSEKKGTGRTILIVIIIVIILFAFKNRITSSFTFLDGVTQAVNFRLVKVKSMLYTQVLKLKSRINDISYIEEYVENNKNRDFELQKNKVQNMEFAYLKEENEKLRQMLEYSEVTLLTSKTSKLSVVLNGTDQQILRGNGNGTFSILNYNEGKVDKNTVFNVETSGVSDILPRGIKIGTLKVTNLNDFNKMKEIRFKPSFNVFDIQSVLVYKWSVNDTINNQIQNQVKAEEEQQNKENSQTN